MKVILPLLKNHMNILKKITFYARFVLAILSIVAIHPIHASANTHDKKSVLNRITVHYDSSIVPKFPISVEYKTMKWSDEFQMHQTVSKIDHRSSHPIKNYFMLKENSKSFSLFSMHVPCSDKKIELIAAEDGDHYFVSYVANGKECYLCIGKQNARTRVTNYEFGKISLLRIK
jgi:hypothetical protein